MAQAISGELHRISVRYLSEYNAQTNPNPLVELVFWRARYPYTNTYTVSLARIDSLLNRYYANVEGDPCLTIDSVGNGLRINLNDPPMLSAYIDY